MENKQTERKSIFLHACCGPCSTAVLERLMEGLDVTVFYYNPNITEADEYYLRLRELEKLLADIEAETGRHVGLVEGEYKPEEYLQNIKGLEQVPEGGSRCEICFRMRLEATAKLAKELGFDYFDTTLSVSPYKSFDRIDRISTQLVEEMQLQGGKTPEYYGGNYKKKDGYRRSVELSKKYGLYRQDYCGCVFSKAEVEAKRAAKASEKQEVNQQ